MPTVVAGLVQEGRLVTSAAAGPGADIGDQYRIGSVTKTLTAVLVLQCQQDGLVALDDALGQYLPESGYGAASLRGLLGHTAGLQAEPVGDWWERSPGTDVATLLARNDGRRRAFAAGEAFHYSNLGFALLGEVVARVRGRSWSELVTERLLVPLGMTRTSYLAEGAHAQGYSVDHFRGTLTPEPHHDTGAMAPAGQLWSTLEDLARWLDFLATGHPDVLGADVLAGMAIPAAPGLDYGLGLRLMSGMVGHTGSMPGFLATAFVERSRRRGVVALANATTGLDTAAFVGELLDADPGPSVPWIPTSEVPQPAAELLGLWFWGNTAHELRWHNERLELRELGESDAGDVFVLEGDRWRGVEGYLMGESLEVTRDADGRPAYLECATFRFTRTPYAA